MKQNYNAALVAKLAKEAQEISSNFKATLFEKQALAGIDALEMRQRIAQIGEAYFQAFSQDFSIFSAHCLGLFVKYPETGAANYYAGYVFDPIAYIVQTYGLPYFEESMVLLAEITKRYTSEFAIRPFIAAQPEKALVQLLAWAKSGNHHLRRLSSEGSRTRLPWGKKLDVFIQNPALTNPILELLKNDSSKYVQTSVANHLNDLSKDNLAYFYSVITKWNAKALPNTQWIIKHALRNEVKKGDDRALKLLGFTAPAFKNAKLTLANKEIELGGFTYLSSDFELENKGKWVIDYAVYLVKANGSSFRKVFKWKTLLTDGNTHLCLRKKIDFKPITTRRYHVGLHKIELLINGQAAAVTTLLLK